jgi:hypothetical protein
MRKVAILLFMAFTIFGYGQSDHINQSSVKGTTDALLQIISGEIDEKRDWGAFRSLFIPTAQFVFVNEKAPHHKRTSTYNLEQFVRFIGPNYAKDGFEELATGLVVHEFNGIANAFQSYTARNLTGTYSEKGINNYQLVKVNDKWFVTSLSWANASESSPIPSQFLD